MEQKTRAAMLTIVLGFNGTGKTTLLKQILQDSGQRALVITPDCVEWTEYPENELNTKKDYLFTGINRHIFNPETTLKRVLLFKKGIILFDDCRAYFQDATAPEVRQLLIRRRQYGVDIFAVGHGFTQVPPVFFTFANTYILFKTVDNINRRKDCISQNFDFIKQSQLYVNEKAKVDPHFYRIINN